VNSSVFLRNFQRQDRNLRRTVFVPNYPDIFTILQYQLSCLINNAIQQSIDHSFSNQNNNTVFSSSVSFTEPWRYEIYWAVRRWPILNGREFSEVSSCTFYSVLLLIAVGYFIMNTEEPKQNGLSESRFGSLIFLFRMAGIPIKMKKVSTVYTVYVITGILCNCSMIIGMFVDVYIHWDELGRAMTSLRVLIPLTNAFWMYSYYR
jgi:hypothetical protein